MYMSLQPDGREGMKRGINFERMRKLVYRTAPAMSHFLSRLGHFTRGCFDYLVLAGTNLLGVFTIYNKVQAGIGDKHVAALVLIETKKSQKLSILILAVMLGYYAQWGFLSAAAWLAFLLLVSSVIAMACGSINPDNFWTIRPLLFVLLHSVPGFSVHIVLLAVMVRASEGDMVMIICQVIVLLGLGPLVWFLKRPHRREESTEHARASQETES
ncbi:hypothetical protein K435DRAFT_357262 [Dendrothele bispora CBS 962.96]|uniref:Uncharacterized protein n=1 Tax=Dendrothele bispora (strain CBS 962.96) TaxID=1314807 RepID=A0A4V4HDF2_DENBC|nr:hypothetical protein K435DRAFT_357262 [Dendrothele bispora CBS 962.96]